jgi:predicted transposase YdaD
MATKPFDPTFKALVETAPDDWPVLAGAARAPAAVIDADIATVSGAADKVLRVRAADPYLLHLEFVAGHDAAELPGLLHVRNTLLGQRHGLPVRSVVVLLRPGADSPVLTGEYVRAFRGEPPYALFRYRVIRVWHLEPVALLAGGVGTLPLALISAVTEAELPGIIDQMQQRLGQRKYRRQAASVWAATYILLGLRYSRELAGQLLRRVLTMKESVTYQAILEEGEALGIVKGEARGALAEAKKLLLLQGTNRFGPPDERTQAAVEGISDLPRLEALSVRLLSARSWQELLGRRGARRQNGRRTGSPSGD